MAQVSVRKVVKEYEGGVQAVKGIDLEIADQEFVVLVGPSGCGKSTTLRMIAGLEEITRRRDLDRRRRGQRRPAARPRHRDGVPELRALSAHDRVRQHGVRAEAAEDSRRTRSSAASTRRRASSTSRAARPQAEGAVRRPAAARRDGPRHRAQPEGVPVRRAAVQPRRQAARADAHRDQEGAPAGRAPRPSTSPTTRSRR